MPQINLDPIPKTRIKHLLSILTALGESGRLVLTPDEKTSVEIDGPNGLRLELSAPYTVVYEKRGDSYNLEFDGSVRLRWMILRVAVSSVTVDASEVVVSASGFKARAPVE